MATGDKKNLLSSLVNSVFALSGEMIEKNGEDSFSYLLNHEYGYIGVFDGCGGIGSRKYGEFQDKTGAYIASHVCAEIMHAWFSAFCESNIALNEENMPSICSSIKRVFVSGLSKITDSGNSGMLKGSLTKNFPTTASMILFTRQRNGVCGSFIWAGDSRGYILTESGLSQMTDDDIENKGDAMENLSDDSRLTNMVCADGDFELHCVQSPNVERGMFITASDGFFAYFSTPMEFEFMLCDTLLASESISQWKTLLREYIKKYTGDDYTMGVVVFGYRNFVQMKKSYEPRFSFLYEKYIRHLDNMDKEAKVALWNEYKKDYYRSE